MTGDYAIVSPDNKYLDVFATSRGDSLQVDGVPGSYATTPLENDPGTERQYARIELLNGAVPQTVTLRNLGDKPVSTAVIKVSDLTVDKAIYDGKDLTVGATGTSAGSYPLTVVGVGPLPDSTAVSFPVSAPPAFVIVKSADRHVGHLPGEHRQWRRV